MEVHRGRGEDTAPILVIDDDADVLQAITEMLHDEGPPAVGAIGIREAEEAARSSGGGGSGASCIRRSASRLSAPHTSTSVSRAAFRSGRVIVIRECSGVPSGGVSITQRRSSCSARLCGNSDAV